MARRRSSKTHGHRVWYIPDGYLPPLTSGQADLVSHESLCLLNPSPHEAHVTLTVYFEDREPIRGISLLLPPERTWHVRLDNPEHLGGHVLPRGVPYALKVESDVPIIVQLSRMDVTQPNLALMTTMGYPAE